MKPLEKPEIVNMRFYVKHRPMHRQLGLSLLELMVALTLGLFVAAGALQVFVGSRQSLDVIQAQSSMQEGARFSFYFIGGATRPAGYLDAGDMSEGNNLFATELVNKFNAAVADPNAAIVANPYVDNPWLAVGDFGLSSVINGEDSFAGSVGSIAVKANTDILRIRMQGDPDGFLSDCEGIAMLAGTVIQTFFVSDDDQLYCMVDTRNPVALVAGIEDMQIQYGLSVNANPTPTNKFIVNQYVNAEAIDASAADDIDWSNVLTVRVGLLAASDDESLGAESQTYTLLDANSVTFTDGKARKEFTQTIALRGNLSN